MLNVTTGDFEGADVQDRQYEMESEKEQHLKVICFIRKEVCREEKVWQRSKKHSKEGVRQETAKTTSVLDHSLKFRVF